MLWIASTAFGLEGQTARDLRRLGMNAKPLQTGGVEFEATPKQALEANMWLRCADRVLLVAGRFEARSFEELFDKTAALPWGDLIPQGGAFPVKAHCAKSRLMSPSDCQSIVKKAVVERLKRRGETWLDESGPVHEIDVSIRSDVVTLALNSSGPALNKRGYRVLNGEAALRETLAAALVLLSPWRPSMPLYDPCCGTGTLLIEAAFIALNRAPGLERAFDMEKWSCLRCDPRAVRAEAREAFEQAKSRPLEVGGSDIDQTALDYARTHLKRAGLEGRVLLEKRDLRDVLLPPMDGVIIANPPYGERMGDMRATRAVESQLMKLKERSDGWTLCAISSDMGFERNAGRRAAKKTRLYNGRLECEFMTFPPFNKI